MLCTRAPAHPRAGRRQGPGRSCPPQRPPRCPAAAAARAARAASGPRPCRARAPGQAARVRASGCQPCARGGSRRRGVRLWECCCPKSVLRASAASACDSTCAGKVELPCASSIGQASLEGAARRGRPRGLDAAGNRYGTASPTCFEGLHCARGGRHPEDAGVGGGDGAEEQEEVLPAVQAAAALGHQQAGRQRAAQDLAPAAVGSAAARPGQAARCPPVRRRPGGAERARRSSKAGL